MHGLKISISHYLVNVHAISDGFCANFNRPVVGHWLAYYTICVLK